MPIYESEALLQSLEQKTKTIISKFSDLQQKSNSALSAKPTDGGWCIAEVLVHLNFYADFYTNAIENAIEKSTLKGIPSFKSGWLGNYFTDIIGPAPENGQLKKKMKSPANARPSSLSNLNPKKEVEDFLNHQTELLSLLQQARLKNLQKIRVPTSLSPLIKMRLGDTFRFVIAHEERHAQQIERLLA